MESVKVEITPGATVSRLEVIIRIFYGFVVLVILCIYIFVAEILTVINFFTCLILAKRVGAGFVAGVIAQVARVYSYLLFVTDERPPLVP